MHALINGKLNVRQPKTSREWPSSHVPIAACVALCADEPGRAAFHELLDQKAADRGVDLLLCIAWPQTVSESCANPRCRLITLGGHSEENPPPAIVQRFALVGLRQLTGDEAMQHSPRVIHVLGAL